MKRTLKANTPWLAAMWLCCGSAVIASDGQATAQEESKSKESVEEIIERVIEDAKSGENQTISVNVEAVAVQEGDDEKPEKKMSGKIVIRKDGGKAEVIDLSELLNKKGSRVLELKGDMLKEMDIDVKDFKFDMQKNGAAFRLITGDNEKTASASFRIGVHCEPVGAALRAHVDVPKTAVVVHEVVENGPAAKAGILVHDILVKAGDEVINSLDGLVTTIQKSDGKELAFTVIRKGSETTISVKPEKRKVSEVRRIIRRNLGSQLDSKDGKQKFDIEVLGDGDLHIEAMSPGVVFEQSEDLEKIMKKLPGMMNRIRRTNEDVRVRVMERGNKNLRARVKVVEGEKQEAHDHDVDEKAHDHSDGDHDEHGAHEHDDEDDDEDDLRARLKQLTREIERLETALKKLKTERR
jgi:hypothetical protein